MTTGTSSGPRAPRQPDPWAEHRHWLARAHSVATAPVSAGGSPHPTVKVGAVLVDARGRELASASNRFADGIDRRRPERYRPGAKSLWVNCAEQLALMQALRQGRKLDGARFYVTLEPCAVCAGLIGEAGIAQIYTPALAMRRYAKLKAKWKASIEVGAIKLAECGVQVTAVDLPPAITPARAATKPPAGKKPARRRAADGRSRAGETSRI